MKNFLTTTSAIALGVFAAPSYAHHGSVGQFDTSKQIEISGVVTKIRFVNPHSYVYFDVTNEDGAVEPWRCEMRSGSILKRTGWSTDMFETGTAIQITGSPARREPYGCLTSSITFEDGRTLARGDVIDDSSTTEAVEVSAALSDGTPNLAGTWVALPRQPGGGPQGDAAGGGERPAGGPPQGDAAAGGERPEGGPPQDGAAGGGRPAGPPPGGGGRGPQYEQTELGKTASAGFVREDNPRFHCQATNLFLDWIFDEHVNAIEQTEDKIVMQFGFMDIVRTIHLDMDSHPKDIVPTRAGHSIGSWEEDRLVVDTIGFLPGYLDATFSGTRHSDAMHVVERFSLSEDGQTLNRTFTAEDALYLSAPHEGSDSIIRTTAEFDPYECEDLTEEITEGF